ncbi:ATP-binding protein, partial [Staphylococcus epidermidis]|uniref:ATP-binding protein n=1 Tax=Staphylococcus epidermidis TaxID=1282 RepID=UPI0037DA1120
MPILPQSTQLQHPFHPPKSQPENSFRNTQLYIQTYIHNPNHIHVQVIPDQFPNIIHFYQRDSSLQPPHQNLVQVPPSL